MKNNFPGVYQIINTLTGKRYIGASSYNIGYRIKRHLTDLREGKHNNIFLLGAWKAYGESAFQTQVLEKLDCENLSTEDRKLLVIDREQFYISNTDVTLLYNLCRKKSNSRLGVKMRTKAKVAISNKIKGRPTSEETKEKLKQRNLGQGLGRKLSYETRTKMSASRKGRKLTETHRMAVSKGRSGIVFSEEHRTNLSIAQKKRYRNQKGIKNDTP